MSDIRERIEKLIAKPSFAFCDDDADKLENWSNWHKALIDRLTEESCLLYSPDGQHFGIAQDKHDKVVGVLIDCQPIRKGVTKTELVEFLKGIHLSKVENELLARIESEGIINE